MTTEVWTPTPGDLLRQAADIAEAWGTCTGQFLSTDGAVCEVGALRAAGGLDTHYEIQPGIWQMRIGTDEWLPIAHQAFNALIAVGGGTLHNDITAKNNSERVAKLREAAAYADEQESK